MHSKSLIELSHITYPDSNTNKFNPLWKYRSKFVLRSLMYYPFFRKLQTGIKPQFLELLIQRHLRFLEKPFRPYLYMGNGPAKRTNLMLEHYRFIADYLPDATARSIYGSPQGLEISRFPVGEQEYHISLCYFSPNHKEGDLCIKLLDQNNTTFYSITFSINDNGKAGRTIIVGGLQGPKSTPEIKDQIKYFTKKHHGQRPKDLMVKVLTIIANIWEVQQLLLVSNKGHIYKSKRYAKGKVKSDYDRHWESLSASRYNKNLYTLSLVEVRKAPEDLKRSKRAMYRQRYQWLDALTEELSHKLALTDTKL